MRTKLSSNTGLDMGKLSWKWLFKGKTDRMNNVNKLIIMNKINTCDVLA
ncbi:hypothetical protein M2273_003911 [Mucilaginibacter lappiensis]|jgi:hypothetical protein